MNYYNPMNGYSMNGRIATPDYGQQKKVPNLQNALDKANIQELMNESDKDEMKVEVKKRDIIRNNCTHKDNNQIQLYPVEINGEVYLKCPICKRVFRMVEASKEEVEAAIQNTIDIIETVKTIGVDVPLSFISELAKLETVLELIPNIHQVVINSWYSKYDQGTAGYNNVGNSASNLVDFVLSGGQTAGVNPIYNVNPALGNINYGYMGIPQQTQMATGYIDPNAYAAAMMQQQQAAQAAQAQYVGMGNQQPMVQPGMNINYPAQENPFYTTIPAQNTQAQVAYGQPPEQQTQQVVQAQVAQPAGPTTTPPTYQAPAAKDESVVTKKMNP